MSTSRVYIRVSMGADGRSPIYELMFEGRKVCELSWTEVLELSMQSTSSLRFLPRK